MTSSEATIQGIIQTIIQGIAGFATASVTINDWSVLDGPVENAPYAIIQTADEFASVKEGFTPNNYWEIRVILYAGFENWDTGFNNFRDARQALLDKFNAQDSSRSLGLAGTNIREIKSDGPIQPYYSMYLEFQEMMESDPIFLFQTIVLSLEEF